MILSLKPKNNLWINFFVSAIKFQSHGVVLRKKMVKSIFLTFGFLTIFLNANCQSDPSAPYLKTKLIPAFKLAVLPDSTSFTEKDLDSGKTTILIYFGADCGHCMNFATRLIDSMSLFKNTQIVMVSSSDFSHIRKFYEDYKLATCPFLTTGKDENYFFISHYSIRMFPSAYVYNKKGKFVKSFESEIEINKLAETK